MSACRKCHGTGRLTCYECHGSGLCKYCDGTGKDTDPVTSKLGPDCPWCRPRLGECKVCKGQGGAVCDWCNGTGYS